MLVLNRRVGESIVIGDDIEIIVKRIGRSCVELSIKADRKIPVRRAELVKRDDEEQATGR